MLTADQARMARAALKWGIRDVAKKTGLSTKTIHQVEKGADAYASTLATIRAAFEKAGIDFIAENGGGPGVRLRKRGKK